MQLNFIKYPGGQLIPASDMDAERMTKFKTGEMYKVEMKLPRNPEFHKKVFSFFQFCFAHWKADREFMDEIGQFEVFRKHLTVLAGFYNEYFNLNGDVRIEAKSLAFDSMDQDQFERVYQALIQAAMAHIFKDMDESRVYEKLARFF